MVKVGGEDLYHVDEELSPVAEEVCEEAWDDEKDDASDLWRDGEHEPRR